MLAMSATLTRTQLVHLLAGFGATDRRTAGKWLDDPDSVRPALRERLQRARELVDAMRSADDDGGRAA